MVTPLTRGPGFFAAPATMYIHNRCVIPRATFLPKSREGQGDECPRIWSKKVKVDAFPYSIPSVGPGADPGVQADSPQVTVSHPPGGRLPLLSARPAVTSQPQSITALWPVPSYTAWRQRHIGVNNLPKVVTQRCLEQDLNPRPTDRKLGVDLEWGTLMQIVSPD